ncbi:hypothetical protein BH09BAC5_BH09BAC5_27990 [soil metagenome]
MRRFVAFTLLFIPIFLSSQILIDQSLGFMMIKQNGFILHEKYPGDLFPTQIKVSRLITPIGGTINLYKPFSKPKAFNKNQAFGAQTGFGFYYTDRDKSLDANYISKDGSSIFRRFSGVFHIPMAIAFRSGSCFEPEKGKPGFFVAAGLDAFYLLIPDEKGFAFLPYSSYGFARGTSGFRASFYHMKFKSEFNSNVGHTVRITNAFFQIEFFHFF